MSISPNELRIGNWVEYNVNFPPTEPIQINEINKNDDFSDCNPIPLTPEILLACGFKDNEQNNSFDIEIKNCGILSFDKDDYSALITGSLKELGFATNSLYKCIHQLQNLYFSLTGEELKINL